jgi:hypothetical protein
MREPFTTRFAPTFSASAGMAEIIATGMPARSSSFAIVAPQRLQVPQVATSSAPATPAGRSSAAISAPIRRACPTAVPTPLVENSQG